MTTDPSMPRLNLLSEARQYRAARSRLISRWLIVCVLVAVASFMPAGALALVSEDDLSAVRARIDRKQEALARIRAERPAIEREIRDLRARSVILDQVENRIDWLPILGSLASKAGDARFEQVELSLAEAGDRIDLRLVGMVETQTQARALVLRLEELGIVQDITMSTNQVRLQREVYRFSINGFIRGGGGDR